MRLRKNEQKGRATISQILYFTIQGSRREDTSLYRTIRTTRAFRKTHGNRVPKGLAWRYYNGSLRGSLLFFNSNLSPTNL